MTTWTRPYEDPIRALTGSMAVFGSGFFALIAILMVVQWHQTSLAEVVTLASFATVWLTFAWRLHRTALLVSEAGVRVRWLLYTRTFAWAQIRAFETDRDIMVPARLWIALANGTRARTPVQRVKRLLFGSMLSDGGTWLRPEAYDRTLSILRRRLAAALAKDVHHAAGGQPGSNEVGHGQRLGPHDSDYSRNDLDDAPGGATENAS